MHIIGQAEKESVSIVPQIQMMQAKETAEDANSSDFFSSSTVDVVVDVVDLPWRKDFSLCSLFKFTYITDELNQALGGGSDENERKGRQNVYKIF